MKSWQLPEYISDLLPPRARQLEKIKVNLLNIFYTSGYRLVSPPLVEYSNSLLTNIDNGLARKTIQVTDQLSGQQLGIRSDITTQITRIDSHLSADNSINRLCYAGPILHSVPQSLIGTREPLQIGAELFGHNGVGADIEIIELMINCIHQFNINELILSIGHIGIFNSLINEAKIANSEAVELVKILTTKDSQAVKLFLDPLPIKPEIKQSLISLTKLYGNGEVIEKAKAELIQTEQIQLAIKEIEKITHFFKSYKIYIDLSELRTDRYHTGLVYGIYADGWPNILAKGGRYDSLGRFFGKARPATGFSFDLKDFLQILPLENPPSAISINVHDYEAAKAEINKLRTAGEIVIIDYGDKKKAEGLNCDRQLVFENNAWVIKPFI